MRVLVTGSAGFIGSHLRTALLRQGHEVRCLARRDSPPLRPEHPLLKAYPVDYGDLSTLLASEALEAVDQVFHLAGVTKGVSYKDFKAWNLTPTENLLKALARRKCLPRRFVLVSSQAAAGPAPGGHEPLTEEDPPRPIEFYGLSKLAAEQAVRRFAARLPFTIVRPATVYGPGDRDFLRVFQQVQHGVSLFPGNRNSFISIIYVKDLVQGLLDAASSPAAEGRTYFLCNDRPVSWGRLYAAVARCMEREIRFSLDLPPFSTDLLSRLGDCYALLTGRPSLLNSQKIKLAKPKYWLCSNGRAKGDFSFRPSTSLQAGLAETLRWYRRRLWLPA